MVQDKIYSVFVVLIISTLHIDSIPLINTSRKAFQENGTLSERGKPAYLVLRHDGGF